MFSDATNPLIPIDVCINLETAKLCLFVFAPRGIFIYQNMKFERLSYL